MIILVITFFNCLIYTQIFFLNKIYFHESLNKSICDPLYDMEFYNILNLIDLLNSTVIPYILMILTSIGLVYKIFKSRKRIKSSLKNKLIKNNDTQFAITSISLNLFSMALNFPFCICVFLEINSTSLVFLICNNLSYTSFSTQFFINYLSNSFFRIELFKLFRIKFRENKISTIMMSTKQCKI